MGRTWSRVVKKAKFPSGGRSFVNVDGNFYAIYGHGNQKTDSNLYNDIWQSKNLGKTWKKISHKGVYRSDMAITTIEKDIIIFGGMDDTPDPERKKWWRRDTLKFDTTKY